MTKKRTNSTHKTSFKVLSIVLSMLIVLSIWVPCTAMAAEVDNRAVDPSTMNSWQNYFGSDVLDTANAGGVWTDKSVFTSAEEINQQLSMKDPDNNFMVALSAIASNKSIKGYTNLPSDTMLVLDVSGSMAQDEYDRQTSEKIDAMVKSTNDAIKKLLDLNYYNRVGVVLYSGSTVNGSSATSTATVLLPLDRYTLSGNVSNYITYSTSGGLSVSLTNGVVDSKGNKLAVVKKNVTGGTYIQNALDKAWDEFYAVEDTTITDIGPQAGTTRIPIMVLMSDGAATTATNSYTNIGASNIGIGTSTDSTMGFAVQLTASYIKKMMEDKYGRSSLFYTLGLGLDHLSGNGEADIAKSVLDPENSTKTINDNWDTFKTLKNGQTMVLSSRNSSNRTSNFSFYGNNLINGIIEETNEIDETEYQYYVDKYFKADNAQGLIDAFTAIVDEIIIQSRYYPTLSEPGNHDLDGYITFEDKIGEYMEVKDVKGLLLGDKYYSGAMMASNFSANGDLGTIENPTALGDEFIRAVKARMGIDTATAQALVAEAYTYKQLYYNSDTDFGNCIEWYEDANGNYCGFHYDGQPKSEIPENAVAYNRSYGFLGETEGSIKDSDMMYVSVKVRTDLATDEQTMYWMIPASLVPVVNYDISMDGKDPETANEITLTRNDADPIRLVYEVGLKEEINPLTVADYVRDDYGYIENGEYVFYTNK